MHHFYEHRSVVLIKIKAVGVTGNEESTVYGAKS